jgi:hypothetical protein
MFENKTLQKSLKIATVRQYYPNTSQEYPNPNYLTDLAESFANVKSIFGAKIDDPAIIR